MLGQDLKKRIINLCVSLFLFGGVGGCIAGVCSKNDFFLPVSVISILPMANIWFGQWLEGKSYQVLTKRVAAIFLGVLSLLLAFIVIVDPGTGVWIVAFLLVAAIFSPAFLAFFEFLKEEPSWTKRIATILIPVLVVGILVWASHSPEELLPLFQAIAVVSIFYVYLSVAVLGYAFWMGRDLDQRPLFGINFLNTYFFFIGSLIGFTIFFSAGFKQALFFLPSDWGSYNEDGDWQSHKETISLLLSFFLSILALCHLEGFYRKRIAEKGREKIQR